MNTGKALLDHNSHLDFTNCFFRKNDIFLGLVQQKTVPSDKMVMFPFAESTVHCLDSS